jgi:hypothetical protein
MHLGTTITISILIALFLLLVIVVQNYRIKLLERELEKQAEEETPAPPEKQRFPLRRFTIYLKSFPNDPIFITGTGINHDRHHVRLLFEDATRKVVLFMAPRKDLAYFTAEILEQPTPTETSGS